MKFVKFESVEALDDAASEWIIKEFNTGNKTLFCPATGSSPTNTYKKLVEKKSRINISQLSFIKLDEWYGLEMTDPGSCQEYLQQHLLGPLNIPAGKIVSFDSKAPSPELECQRIDDWLEANGPIDICILGIGLNGHIAFNEPDNELEPGAHPGKLSATSLSHPMLSSTKRGLQMGLTLGMANILQSKKILLIVNGNHKREILGRLMGGKISTGLPASFLWLHPEAYCFHCVD
jgi:galactosamine-6-phosphate isomerase